MWKLKYCFLKNAMYQESIFIAKKTGLTIFYGVDAVRKTKVIFIWF